MVAISANLWQYELSEKLEETFEKKPLEINDIPKKNTLFGHEGQQKSEKTNHLYSEKKIISLSKKLNRHSSRPWSDKYMTTNATSRGWVSKFAAKKVTISKKSTIFVLS